MQDWQIGLTWLSTKLSGIEALGELIGEGEEAKAFNADKVPKDVEPPFMTVQRIASIVAHPIGASPTATTMTFDIALWALGNDDTDLVEAMDAIDAVLADCPPEMCQGKQVSSAVVGDLPPAPPPQQPGDPEAVRLGRTYELFVGGT